MVLKYSLYVIFALNNSGFYFNIICKSNTTSSYQLEDQSVVPSLCELVMSNTPPDLTWTGFSDKEKREYEITHQSHVTMTMIHKVGGWNSAGSS